MELNKNNREVLLNILSETEQERERFSTLVNKSQNDLDKDCWEMHHYVALQKIAIVKAALINNDIDY